MTTVSYSSLEEDNSPAASSFRRRLASFFGSWYSRLVIFCALLFAILLFCWIMYPRETDSGAEKRGAGLLLVNGQKVLLLLRKSKHNDQTWGLPGGNVDSGDADLLETATREATEELGGLPQIEVLTEISTKRGKRQQKQYSVFVCNLTAQGDREYTPQLNEEHRAFQWFDVGEVSKLQNLHPVVSILFRDPVRKQLAVAIFADVPPHELGRSVEKRGAGLFLMAGLEVLLLTRNSSHNNATLSVPGGNVDLDDTHLLATAKREAEEEMGACPDFEYKGEVDTLRGKHNQKEFKLFLGAVTAEVRAGFRPVLSSESLAWGWYTLEDLLQRGDLHPVVEVALRDHLDEIKDAFSISVGDGK